jgi:hypothetical protein
MRITLNELKSIITEELYDAQSAHVMSNINAAVASLEKKDPQTAASFLQRALDKLNTMNPSVV